MSGNAHRGGRIGRARWSVLAAMSLLAACRVVTVEEDREIRARNGGDFDAARYVATIWQARAMPTIDREAVPAQTLLPALATNLDAAGAEHGRRVGEGSAWTFVLRGEGRVSAVDTTARRGTATVTLADGRTLSLQVGPVVTGTAIRDALPFVAFNDFADQLAFADVGRALTARALAGVRPVVASLRPGQQVRFVGVANVRDASEPLVVTPIALAVDHAG